MPPDVACLACLIVHSSPTAVSVTALAPLSLWVLPQCMPGDIAGWLSEGVADPTPLAPFYLDVDSFLFSSCPQFFIPDELWALNAHYGPQASVAKDYSLLEVAFVTLHVSEPNRRIDFTFVLNIRILVFLDITCDLH